MDARPPVNVTLGLLTRPTAQRLKKVARVSPDLSGRHPWIKAAKNSEPCRGAMIPDFGRRDLCRPLRGLGILREPDPRVTLAALTHPGLNSVAGYAGLLMQTSTLAKCVNSPR